jgi:hypothetical protein
MEIAILKEVPSEIAREADRVAGKIARVADRDC